MLSVFEVDRVPELKGFADAIEILALLGRYPSEAQGDSYFLLESIKLNDLGLAHIPCQYFELKAPGCATPLCGCYVAGVQCERVAAT